MSMNNASEDVLTEEAKRARKIVRTSVVGILANALLAAFKAVVGIMANSIAITLDAVNNLTDAASSVITIVGTKLAGREANRKHPFGYGRIEYLTSMIIAVLVLYAGITSLIESVRKIIHPETADYSAVALVIVAVAVVVKIVLGRYVKRVGESVNSDSLINSGTDATLDSIISASTLVAAILYLTLDISIEAWLGAVIAAVIIKAGLEMLWESISKILGENSDTALSTAIKKTVCSFPEVRGAYDLVLHNYGPDMHTGSIHIEVLDTLPLDDLDELDRKIMVKVYQEHHVLLTAVGVYAMNTQDPDIVAMRERVAQLVLETPYVLQTHAFHVNREEKHFRFDVVISFDAPSTASVLDEIRRKVTEAYPGYTVEMAVDRDFTSILEDDAKKKA